MAKQSDINLVLKAKNEASKGISEVTAALKALQSVQSDTADGADKAQSSLSALGQGMNKLNQEVKSLSTLEKVAAQLGTAAAAIERLSKSVNESEANIGKLDTEYRAASASISEYADKVFKALAAQKKQEEVHGRAVKAASELTREVSKANTAYKNLSEKIKELKEPSVDLVANLKLQKDNLDKMVASQKDLIAKRDQEKKTLVELKSATNQYSTALNSAEKNQERLATKLEKSTIALKDEKAKLGSLKSELNQVSESAQQAARGLGVMELTSEGIAISAQKAQAQLKALADAQTRLQASQNVNVKDVAASSAIEQLRNIIQLKKAQKEAADEATRLGKATAGAAVPNKDMADSFELAKLNAQSAKNEYLAYVAAVRNLNGVNTGAVKSGLQLAEANARSAQAAAAAAKALSQAAASAKTATQAESQLNQTSSAYAKIRSFINEATAKTTDEQNRNINSTRTALSLYQRLRGQVLGLSAAYIGFFQAVQQINSVIDIMRSVASAQSKLTVAFGTDARVIASEMDFLRQTSVRLGQDFSVLAEQYSNFAVAAMGANYGVESTRKIFTSTTEAARVLGTSTEGVGRVFTALNQMISKGFVQAEELRGQLGDSLTGAFQLFAQAIGVTTAELDAMLKKGGLVPANRAMMEKFADTLTDKFGVALPAALQKTTTKMDIFFASISVLKDVFAKGGFDAALGRFFDRLNSFTTSKEGVDFFKSLGAAAGKLVDALTFVSKNMETVAEAIKVVLSLKLAQYLASQVGQVGMLQKAWVTLKGAVTAANLVLSNETLPVMTRLSSASAAFIKSLGAAALLNGVLSVAIFGVLSLAQKWLGTTEDLNASLDKHLTIVEKVRQAYSDQARGLSDWKKGLESVSSIDIKVNTEALNKDLKALKDNLRKQTLAATTQGSLSTGSGLNRQLYQDLNRLSELYAQRSISVTQFKTALDTLRSSPSYATSGITTEDIQVVLDSVQAIEDRTKAIRMNELAQKSLNGTLTESEKAELNLVSAVSDANEELLKNEALQNYTKVMDGLKSAIPELADEVKKIGELKAIDDMVNGLDRARIGAEEYAEALKRADEARRAINAKYDTKSMQVDKSYADKVVLAESGGRANASNPASSALGVGQFIEKTWLELFKKYFPNVASQKTEQEILALRTDADASRQLIEAYAAENSKLLQEAGVAVDDAARYLAHFLGPSGAIKLLQAKGDTPVADILSPQQVSANQSVLGGKNAGQVVAWARQKMQITEQELGIVKMIDDAEQKRIDAQAEAARSLDETIASKEIELQQTDKTTRALAVQKAEQEALNRLNKERGQLSAEEAAKVAKIGELAGQVYDIEQGRADIDNEVNRLLADRQELMSQMTLAQEQGDAPAQVQLAAQIEEVNAKMREAIDTAISMWKAIGGNEAESATLKLEGMKRGLKGVKQESDLTGKAINGMITDGLVSKFNTFLDSVFEGKNIFSSLRDAFLQFAADFLREIANLILKQAIFNALGGGKSEGGIGGAIASAIGGQFHTGGVVGAGGTPRAVSPSWFNNALRYHTGGIAGLRANEVPAVLQKGEEVLTASDPRHINNGGAQSTPMSVKVVNAIDPADFISAGLNSPVGEKALLNYIRSNQGAVRAAMGA